MLTTLVLGLEHDLVVIMAATFCQGLALALALPPIDRYLADHSPRRYRARVQSIFQTMNGASTGLTAWRLARSTSSIRPGRFWPDGADRRHRLRRRGDDAGRAAVEWAEGGGVGGRWSLGLETSHSSTTCHLPPCSSR